MLELVKMSYELLMILVHLFDAVDGYLRLQILIFQLVIPSL